MESEDAVREHLLAANGTKLRALLQRLSGTAQLTVKGFYDDERLLREIVRSNPAVAGLQKKLRGLPEEATYYERIRLGEAVAAEFEQARQRGTEPVVERLSPIALHVKVMPPTSAAAPVNLAFPVRRS